VSKRAEYTGKLSSWTESLTKELDGIFLQVYMKLSSNQYSFPTDLLNLSTDHCGLGFCSISDDIQKAKYSMFQRHLKTGGLVAENMDILLFNAVLKYSQFPLPELRITLTPRSDLMEACWANSPLTYAAKGGVYLTRQGSIPSPASLPTVTPPSGDDVLPPRAWIAQRNISTQGDLYSFSREGSPPGTNSLQRRGL